MISSLYKKHSITFFYLMLLLVFSHSFISAQTPDMPFNIYLKQASLKEFTAKIEQLSEYSFIYGEEVVLKHPITLDLKETPLTTILQTAFIKQDISIILKSKFPKNPKRNVQNQSKIPKRNDCQSCKRTTIRINEKAPKKHISGAFLITGKD